MKERYKEKGGEHWDARRRYEARMIKKGNISDPDHAIYLKADPDLCFVVILREKCSHISSTSIFKFFKAIKDTCYLA